MKRLRRNMLAGAILAAIAGAAGPLAAQGNLQQDLAAGSMIEQVKKSGQLRIGITTFVPWSMRAANGDLIGFEVDVAKKIADDLGVKAEFVPTAWDGIIPALLAGKFDLIVSGMSITPARNLTVNFTIPYAHSGQGMVANKSLAAGFATLADFNKPEVTIACRRGIAGCAFIEKNMPKATLRLFDDDAQALQEVLNGRAHAWIASMPRPLFAAQDHADLLFMPFSEPVMHSDEAFAVRKGDADSLNWLDNWITYRTSDGWLKERHDYWFTTQAWREQVKQ
jgi:polar amino acid transport system substrate-binding protein